MCRFPSGPVTRLFGGRMSQCLSWNRGGSSAGSTRRTSSRPSGGSTSGSSGWMPSRISCWFHSRLLRRLLGGLNTWARGGLVCWQP